MLQDVKDSKRITVNPSPATHAIWTQLKAGDIGCMLFYALYDTVQDTLWGVYYIKTLLETRFRGTRHFFFRPSMHLGGKGCGAR